MLPSSSVAESLASLNETDREAVLDALDPEQFRQLAYDWSFWARPGQLPPDGDWRGWLLMAGRGYGKALALDTPLPTPTGWTTMGAVGVGDWLFDEGGAPCRVTFATGIQRDRRCYRVGFDDGTEIVADADHRWLTWDKRARKAHGRAKNPTIDPGVRTTDEIRDTLVYSDRERNHSIPVAAPLETPELELPIDPYVLGCWLGDGSTAGAEVTVHDSDADEMLGFLSSAGAPVTGAVRRADGAACATYRVGGRPQRRCPDTGRMLSNGSLHSRLREHGLLGNKHIPAQYLRGSPVQRWRLLAGLMDTDGSISRGGQVEYCSKLERLSRGVFELAVSLGFKPVLRSDPAVLGGRRVGNRWRVTWTPREAVFRLERKRDRTRYDAAQSNRTAHRYIVAVEPCESVPVRCITVDSRSSLFLAGESMVPTHNTRTGGEWVRAGLGPDDRVALVGPTTADVRDTMVEGESGLLAISPPWDRPSYEPSKRRITWPNGAIATTFSADEPDRLRGPQFTKAWCDEIAAWRYPEAWSNLMFALRLGDNPRWCATTTPKPVKLVRDLLDTAGVVVTRGSTYENRANLAGAFLDEIVKKYEGTRLGRQELMGELLEDVPGALWNRRQLDDLRVAEEEVPELERVVVAIDPAVTSGDDADETGIIVAGVSGDHGYVLADASCRASPDTWARRAVDLYHEYRADRIVAEVNNGGDLVESILRTVDRSVPYRAVHASRGKRVRAEPVAALYEQGRCHHVGTFDELEDQMCLFTPDTKDSPDRVDALVWAFTELILNRREIRFRAL